MRLRGYRKSNDFGNYMGRYYYNQKQEADSLKKIQTWFLKKYGYFNTSWMSGTITWSNRWSDTKSSVSIRVNISEYENYLQLIYTQTDRDTGEKKDFDYKIPLTTTPCYFGGKRFWFTCIASKSGVYCGRRVAVLYKGGDYFACRHCYDLSYESKNENRRFSDYSLFYVLNSRNKIDELEKTIKRRRYKGKPTRKQKKLNNLYAREFPYAIDIYKKHKLT